MNTAQQKANFVREIREAASYLLKSWEMLDQAKTHWSAEDLGNVLVDADLVGTEHEGLTISQLQTVCLALHSIILTEIVPQISHLYAIEIDLPRYIQVMDTDEVT